MKEIDAKDFFNSKLKNYPMFGKTSFKRAMGWRRMGWQAYREGKLSLVEMLVNLLPGAFKPEKLLLKFTEYAHGLLNEVFAANGLYDCEYVLLYGLPFRPAREKTVFESWLIFFITYFQLCVMDQYQTLGYLKMNSVVIEAGGNIGVFSVLAANACRSGMVYVFEPNPTAYEALTKNISYYHNIKAYNKGLGPSIGRKTLVTSETSNKSYLNEARGENDAGTEKSSVAVEIETIDGFTERERLNKVDFLEVDVEGSEAGVIEGARETIAKFSPVIAISAYHKKEDKKELPRLILSINPGYSYKLHKDAEEDFIFEADSND